MKVLLPTSLSSFVEGASVVRSSAGHDAAAQLTLEALFVAHASDVYRFVRHQLGPGAEESDVEDLTQNVFIAAGKGLAGFRGDSKPTTWLYRISSRTVLAFLESRKRHRALLARLEERSQPLDPVAVGADKQFEQWEEVTMVWQCLMRIKPKKRMVLVLNRVEGFSGKQIAEILQIKEATVWTRLHHARRELACELERLRRKGDWNG